LVVLDPDHPKLKRLFTEVMLRDVQLQEAPEAARPMENVLSAHGKVPLSIRPINLFYLGDTYRLRIDPVRNGFRTADERFRWSAGELEEEINSFPERFSPNVVLRPLYQQRILPNIAYVGGPAEIVYWLQLRPVFSLHQTAYPVLVPRAHGALLESTLAHRFERLGFRGSDWLASAETLTERFIAARGVSSRPFDETMEAIAQRMQALTDFVEQTDKTLGDAGRAETARIRQSIDRLQEKWTKAVKRQEEQSLQQIRKVRERLFPTGIPQERYENILGLIGTGSLRHPLDLLEFADPLKRTFSVIRLGSHDQLHHAGEQQDA
jgi:bacillithiol biosynthesis cysteine-adding enzyme BshC